MKCHPDVIDALYRDPPPKTRFPWRKKDKRGWFVIEKDGSASFRDSGSRPTPNRVRCPSDWDVARAVEDSMEKAGYLHIDDMYDGHEQGVHHFVAPDRKTMETVVWKGADLHLRRRGYEPVVV